MGFRALRGRRAGRAFVSHASRREATRRPRSAQRRAKSHEASRKRRVVKRVSFRRRPFRSPFRDSAPHSWLPAPDARGARDRRASLAGGCDTGRRSRRHAESPSRTTTTSRGRCARRALCLWPAHEVEAVLRGRRSYPKNGSRSRPGPSARRLRDRGLGRPAGWRRAAPALFRRAPWPRCGRRAGREASRRGARRGSMPARPRALLRDARRARRPRDVRAFLNAYRGGGVAVAASRTTHRAVHVWRADTGASLSRVREPQPRDGDPSEPSAADFASRKSRDAAFAGWERRARAIERPEADRRRSNGPHARRGRGRGR